MTVFRMWKKPQPLSQKEKKMISFDDKTIEYFNIITLLGLRILKVTILIICFICHFLKWLRLKLHI